CHHRRQLPVETGPEAREQLRVAHAGAGIPHEQHPEEQQLLAEEGPHPQGDRIALVARRRERRVDRLSHLAPPPPAAAPHHNYRVLRARPAAARSSRAAAASPSPTRAPSLPTGYRPRVARCAATPAGRSPAAHNRPPA